MTTKDVPAPKWVQSAVGFVLVLAGIGLLFLTERADWVGVALIVFGGPFISLSASKAVMRALGDILPFRKG